MWLVWLIHTWFRTFVLGGDDGIRLSRELRARSFAALTIINRHSLPLLLRIPSIMELLSSSPEVSGLNRPMVEMMGFDSRANYALGHSRL